MKDSEHVNQNHGTGRAEIQLYAIAPDHWANRLYRAFASSPPTVDTTAAAASMVWSYIGELIFNMLILVGSVKMADRVVHEMMGL